MENQRKKTGQAKTLYDKVFDMHIVSALGDEQYLLFIGLHLIHEATSPQAFEMLRERGIKCAYPAHTFATADHVIPTDTDVRPFTDQLGEKMLAAIEQNVTDHEIRFFSPSEKSNGIVHVIAPERGLTQPGMTIACGDSHTSTHGAFGAIALGIGTTQVRDLLATQTIITNKLKVRRIEINGELRGFATAKDVILHVIRVLGPKAGVGHVYEFAGTTVEAMSIEERMTICNMAVEAGARCGYVNPDQVTFDFLGGAEFAPEGDDWEKAVDWWRSIASDPDAVYSDVCVFDAAEISPMTTWGVNPGQSIGVTERIPVAVGMEDSTLDGHKDALAFMGLEDGVEILGTKIDVAFIGSCTNGRFSDFEYVARHLAKTNKTVQPGVRALVVPGSHAVMEQMVKTGVKDVFENAGFEVRLPGCSMCLAMNPDKLVGNEVCASSSNRNFKGRQGSPTGRTLIMSPIMVAAAALMGGVSDPDVVFAG